MRAALFAAVLVLVPRLAFSAIALDAGFPKTGTKTDGSNASATYTTGGTNRFLVITCVATDSAASVTGFTISGSALTWTAQISSGDGTGTVEIFTAPAPSVVTETATCVRDDNTNGISVTAVFSFSGASTTPGNVNDTQPSGNISIALTAAATSSYLIGAAGADSNTTVYTAKANSVISTQAIDGGSTGTSGVVFTDATPVAGSVLFGTNQTDGIGFAAAAIEIRVAPPAAAGTGGMMGFF